MTAFIVVCFILFLFLAASVLETALERKVE